MRVVIQRVKNASVSVKGEITGEIQNGYLILLGVMKGDTESQAQKLVSKIVNLRIFEDESGKINLSLLQTGGEVLVVSQFTLGANCRHGNRPDFLSSAPPNEANVLYEYFISLMKEHIKKVECGVFGAEMQVCLCNDGPFTVLLDTDTL